MLNFLKSAVTVNVFPTLCYLLAVYFLYAFGLHIGFPPTKPLNATSGSFLALALFTFMLPEAKKLRLGHLFEYEARVREMKEDIREFKDETRATLSAHMTLVSTITNAVSQTVNVNLPGKAEAIEAKKELESALTTKTDRSEIERDIDALLIAEENDLSYTLAKLRMQLEKELRRILGKRTETMLPSEANLKFLSARSLFSQFVESYPKYSGMRSSFDYVLRICNAAIHGQFVPEGYVHEALSMGIKILKELKEIPAHDS